MSVCQGRSYIEAQTKLESVDYTINRHMRFYQDRITETQTNIMCFITIIINREQTLHITLYKYSNVQVS